MTTTDPTLATRHEFFRAMRSARDLTVAGAMLFALCVGCGRSTDLEGLLKSADKLFQERKFEAAKIQYFNILRIQETNGLARMRLGRIFFEQGQIPEAFQFLVSVRDQFPDEIPVRESLAVIYSLAGTNLWKGEVDAVLRSSPTNETAWLTWARSVRGPEGIAEFTNSIARSRQTTGDRAIYHLAEADLSRRQGESRETTNSLRRAVDLEPNSVSALASLANALLASGEASSAITLLERASRLSPPHGSARLRYAQVLNQAGKKEDAKAVLDEMNLKAPEAIGAWTARAEIAFQEKDLPGARALVSRTLAQSRSDPMALRLQARIDLAENKPGEAVKSLETVASRLVGSSDLQFQLGVAHMLNRNLGKAIEHLKESTRLDPKAVDPRMLLAELEVARGGARDAVPLLEEVIRQAPAVPHPRLLLGRAYRTLGRFDEALGIYSEMRKLFPTNSAPLLQSGLVLRSRGRDAEARKSFETCLDLDPTVLSAFEQLVQLDVKAGDRAKAMERVDQRIAADPKQPLYWLIKSELLRTTGDVSGTEAALRRVLEIEPESQNALLSLANLYASAGRNTEAIAELSRALEKTPNNVGALTLIGMIHVESGQFQEARTAYEKALSVQTNSPVLLNNLAVLLVDKFGSVEEAHELALRAHRASPQSPAIADTLGWIEYRKGNYPEAIRHLTTASDNLGGNPEVQYHLGMAHYMMGQEAPARTALALAVQGNSTYSGKDVAKSYFAVLENTASDDPAASIQVLERRLQEAPKDVIALSRLAKFNSETGRREKAIELYEAALKSSPDSPGILVRLAAVHADSPGDKSRAMELAKKARQLAPDDPEVSGLLGRVTWMTGDHAHAFSLLQASVARAPNNFEMQTDLAKAAYSVGRVDEATNALGIVVREASGTIRKKAAEFHRLIEIATRPRPEDRALVDSESPTDDQLPARVFAQAQLDEIGNQTEAAIAKYESVLKRFPVFVPAARRLAIVLAEIPGREARASELAVKTRRDLPRDEELGIVLAKLAARRGEHQFALSVLADAARKRPDDGSLAFHLGLVYSGLQRTNEARASLQRAVQLSPRAQFAAEANRLLLSFGSNGPR